jgi:FlaG/FlaF family flagellin (archaellin)
MIEGLTPREQEILELLATGKANKQIAHDLDMHEDTVKHHVSEILRKLDVPEPYRRGRLVRGTRESGMIDLPRRWGIEADDSRVLGSATSAWFGRLEATMNSQRSPVRSGLLAVGIAVGLLTVIGAACGGSAERASTTSTAEATSHTSVSSAVSGDHGEVYRSAVSEVQQFLDDWKTTGQTAAWQRYMAGSQPPSGAGQIELVKGSVQSYTAVGWQSANHFTLRVDMELHFASSDGGAFGEGTNTRFITFTRPNPSTVYRMSWATSP